MVVHEQQWETLLGKREDARLGPRRRNTSSRRTRLWRRRAKEARGRRAKQRVGHVVGRSGWWQPFSVLRPAKTLEGGHISERLSPWGTRQYRRTGPNCASAGVARRRSTGQCVFCQCGRRIQGARANVANAPTGIHTW